MWHCPVEIISYGQCYLGEAKVHEACGWWWRCDVHQYKNAAENDGGPHGGRGGANAAAAWNSRQIFYQGHRLNNQLFMIAFTSSCTGTTMAKGVPRASSSSFLSSAPYWAQAEKCRPNSFLGWASTTTGASYGVVLSPPQEWACL